MDAQNMISAIGSVGFPIVACVGLFTLYDKTIKEIVNALAEVKSTLNNVNTTLNKIDSALEDIKND